MSDNKHTGGSRGARGYYIALILCACAIGITGYVYQRNQQPQEVVMEASQPEEIPVGTVSTEENIPALATEPTKETATEPTQAATQPAVTKKLVTASPLAGEEIYGYSMEALSYNQTTRDWRVHNGVDIAAEEGTPVLAAADGTVYTTYEDDAMGHTVVIRHLGGYTTKYSSLGEDLSVSAGDTVQLGQTIGTVGSSALLESALGSHLHFAVTHQDKAMDPAEFLAMGQE